MFACYHFYFRLQLPLIIIHITCISLSLPWTSAPIHLTNVLGVLGTQETSCILIAGLLERDIFDLYLPEFDKPWVIHLRKTCCCSTNLCTWRPNTVYKNRIVRRHQPSPLPPARPPPGWHSGQHNDRRGDPTRIDMQLVCEPLFDEAFLAATQESWHSHRTGAYNDKEDLMLCDSWLHIGTNPASGAE
jgi:hypothetical protein